MLLVEHVSNPIDFEPVEKENPQINVFVIGIMGAGKSCLLNKLSYEIERRIQEEKNEVKSAD